MSKHPSHVTRSSDSLYYDEVCLNCGATDIAGGGWGKLGDPCGAPDVWRPECKYDVLDLLLRVQAGQVSCGFAADVLFPDFSSEASTCNARYIEILKKEEVETDEAKQARIDSAE